MAYCSTIGVSFQRLHAKWDAGAHVSTGHGHKILIGSLLEAPWLRVEELEQRLIRPGVQMVYLVPMGEQVRNWSRRWFA